MIINHKVEKNSEKKYYTVNFDVPKNVKKLTVSYSYPKVSGTFSNVVDFGLEDSDGNLVGWSGSDRKSVYVGEEESSAGFLKGEIKSGQWKIIVGAYRIEESGVDVKYEIDFEFKENSLYFGDLHTHSTASDGEFDIYALAKRAKQRGLQFLAVSNHNNYSENLNLPNIDGITLIHAVEWTHYMGHVNFFGVKKPFDKSFIANDEEEKDAIIDYAKKAGAIVSANHPHCRYCPYKWQLEDAFEFVEIWNGPMRSDETKSIEWFKEQIFKGKRLVAIGGSDYHRRKSFVTLGNPVTAIVAKSRSEAELLDGIKKGHCFVTKSVKGVVLEIDVDGKTFGDDVSLDGKSKIVKINAFKMKRGDVLKVQFNGKTLAEFNRKACEKTIEIKINEKGALIVEVLGKSLLHKGQSTQCIANPIYFCD